MQTPDVLASLQDEGIIERVLRPLMSGKEAQVYLVVSRGTLAVAKVYKEAHQRSFKHRAAYTEGRSTRNSRDQRAMSKHTKHGRAQDEAAWRSTEVDVIHRLHAGGVRVPTPHAFIDGVLIMECVVDAEGEPAPRLSELSFTPEEAAAVYDRLIRETVRMLAAGIVHGDLSEFNVLIGADGPVVIDFPQSVDTARNTNARRLLLRDVDNLHRFLQRFAPNAPRRPLAEEMWDLFEQNALTADTQLTGRYRAPRRSFGGGESVQDLIREADHDERKRREALGLRGGPDAQRGQAPRAPAPHGQAPRGHGPRGEAGPPRAEQGAPRDGGAPAADRQGPRNDQQGPRRDPQGPRRDWQGPRSDWQGPPRDRQGPRGDQQGAPRNGQGTPREAQGAQQGQRRGPPHEQQGQRRGPPHEQQGAQQGQRRGPPHEQQGQRRGPPQGPQQGGQQQGQRRGPPQGQPQQGQRRGPPGDPRTQDGQRAQDGQRRGPPRGQEPQGSRDGQGRQAAQGAPRERRAPQIEVIVRNPSRPR